MFILEQSLHSGTYSPEFWAHAHSHSSKYIGNGHSQIYLAFYGV